MNDLLSALLDSIFQRSHIKSVLQWHPPTNPTHRPASAQFLGALRLIGATYVHGPRRSPVAIGFGATHGDGCLATPGIRDGVIQQTEPLESETA